MVPPTGLTKGDEGKRVRKRGAETAIRVATAKIAALAMATTESVLPLQKNKNVS